MTDWYDEVEIFSNKHVEPFKFSTPTGHYTQVVWADTDKVGCGATSYRDGKWFATLYTCNYGPNGNFIRGQMYADGAACSQCSSGSSCSSQYPGLCGQYPPTLHLALPSSLFFYRLCPGKLVFSSQSTGEKTSHCDTSSSSSPSIYQEDNTTNY